MWVGPLIEILIPYLYVKRIVCVQCVRKGRIPFDRGTNAYVLGASIRLKKKLGRDDFSAKDRRANPPFEVRKVGRQRDAKVSRLFDTRCIRHPMCVNGTI